MLRRRRAAAADAEAAGFFEVAVAAARHPALYEAFVGGRASAAPPQPGAGLGGLADALAKAAAAADVAAAATAQRVAADQPADAPNPPSTTTRTADEAAFVREVVRLFRGGRDVGVDYAKIDADSELDDHDASVADVDAAATEAWFDGESE